MDKDNDLEGWITEIKDEIDVMISEIDDLLKSIDEIDAIACLIIPTHEGNTTRH